MALVLPCVVFLGLTQHCQLLMSGRVCVLHEKDVWFDLVWVN